MAILGIDMGMKHTGVCIYLEGICMPRGTFSTGQIDSELQSIINEYDINIVVIGLPYSLDGRETAMCTWIRDFVRSSALLSAMHVEYVNEALTSKEAENLMRDNFNVQKRKQHKDAVAACLILENYINAQEKE